MPMPLAHTVELNAGTVDTERPAAARQLDVGAVGARSDADQPVERLWFEALAGICAHVRAGGGGLTPSDIAPARLSQPQLDELQQQYAIADVLPLTPLQQGLLFHASTAQGSDDLYAVQLDITVTGALEPSGCAMRCTRWSPASAPGGPVLREFDEPVQVILADPGGALAVCRLTADGVTSMSRSQGVCAAERAAVCDLAEQSAFRAALIRTAEDRHRFVLTNHHIVLDGWSMPILLQEIFAGYYGQRLPAAAPYRRFVTWLAERDLEAARTAWREVFAGFDTPTLVGPPDRFERGSETSPRTGCLGRPPKPLPNWRARITPRSTPCCRARARNCCAS